MWEVFYIVIGAGWTVILVLHVKSAIDKSKSDVDKKVGR